MSSVFPCRPPDARVRGFPGGAMKTKFLLAAAVVISGALAPPALAGDFCTEMKAVVADAPNGFSAFRGTLQSTQTTKLPDPSEEYGTIDIVTEYYSASGWPDGAQSCRIEVPQEDASEKRRYAYYTCAFPVTGTDVGAATSQFASRVGACLGDFRNPVIGKSDRTGAMLIATANDGRTEYWFSSGSYDASGRKRTITFKIQSDME